MVKNKIYLDTNIVADMIDWQVLPFGKDVIAEGIDLSLENDLDLEDILQCLCAKKSGCETLVSKWI